jgi:hypothetical protein
MQKRHPFVVGDSLAWRQRDAEQFRGVTGQQQTASRGAREKLYGGNSASLEGACGRGCRQDLLRPQLIETRTAHALTANVCLRQ